jgi:hypothetical protein
VPADIPDQSALAQSCPTRPTTWLVHPVGLADLGVQGDPGGELEHLRLLQLKEAIVGEDPDRLWKLVWKGEYATEPDALQPAASSSRRYRALPLPKVLRGLAASGEGVTRVRVLLVAATSDGPRSAGLQVCEVGRCLADAVTLLRGMIHRELGPALEIVDGGCAFPTDLAEQAVLAALVERHRALRPEAPDRVTVSWGSGATSTSFSAISAAVQLRLPWRLLDYTSPKLNAAVEVDPLAAVDPSLPLAVPYLTRLRLFHELARAAGLDGTDPEPQVRLTQGQERAVSAMVDLVDRGYRAGDAEALRQVAWEALVRWDGTAGFALRRYVIARYHEMCAHLGVPPVETLDEVKKRGKGQSYVAILGDLQELAARGVEQDPTHRPNVWLASEQVDVVNRYGSAAHNLAQRDAADAERIACWMVRWDGLSLAEADLVTRLGVRPSTGPGSGLLAVWPVGIHVGDGRPSVAQHLLQEEQGDAVGQFLGSVGFPLHALLLATPDSRPAAERQREQLDQAEERTVTAAVQLVGPDRYDQELVRSQVRVYLSEILAREGDSIGGLLLVPTGPKAIVLAALQELFRVSAERAIPLFVRDVAADGTTLGGLHLWPAAVGHDRPLLTAALGALDRLELDAAARLLAGTAQAETLAVECQALARAFTGRDEDWSTWQRPATKVSPEHRVTRGRLAQRLELVQHGASLLKDSNPDLVVLEQPGRDRNTLLTRFLVLASTLVENWRPLLCLGGDVSQGRRDKWHYLDQAARPVKAGGSAHPAKGHAAVLLTLRTARNKIPITHNHAPDAEQAVQCAVTGLKYAGRSLPAPWPEPCSPLALLHAAPEAAVPWDLPAPNGPTLLDRWRDLRRRLVQALDEGGTPQSSDLQ